MKFSSGLGEQVKGKPLPDSDSRGLSVAVAGIILPQGRLSLPTTPSNDEGNSQRGMKFSEKYELLETLTTGAVETFAAHDRVRGERVLVHIVECPTQKSDQTTAEWVLESFRKQAPEPPGTVLETGKYSGAKYGYVVIKSTDETSVKRWVRQYEIQADETKETNVHQRETAVSAAVEPTAAPPVTVKQAPQAPGSMTQLFRDFDSLGKSKGPDAAAPADLSAHKPAPSTSLPGDSGLHASTPWDPASARPNSLSDEPPFSSSAPPKPAAPDLASSVNRQSSKPGEFTSFFQGPFQGDRPAEMPSFSSQPIEPPKKNVGEFTALFGRTTTPAPASPASSSASEGSFTSIFKDMGMTPQPAINASPVQGGIIPAPIQPLPTASQGNAPSLPDPVFVAPPPVVTPTPPVPLTPHRPSAVEIPPAPRSGLPSNDATGAFMHPSAEPAPVPVEAPTGPSPYTQIISRPKHVETEEATTGSAPAAGGGQFAAPSMPKIPGAAPPPMPKMPPPPRVAAPPMPKMKAPPTPKMPKVDAPAPPPVSIWPLIITLTVLFFLAVLLVLYFVLKH